MSARMWGRARRRAWFGAVRDELGALHVLVNNAGMAPRVRADLLEATEESFGEVMRTNLAGPYFLTQAMRNAGCWSSSRSTRRGAAVSSTSRPCPPSSPRLTAANTACRRQR